MDLTRKHIALLVLSEDERKTPLANLKTEALLWWNALDARGQHKAYSQLLLKTKPENPSWQELQEMHEKITSKVSDL